MFIYEDGNSLNLTLTGNKPVETPDVIIKGFKEGAAVIVGSNTYGVNGTEYEGKAQTLVYQKDGKLVITFRGIAGMNDPEVTIDEVGAGEYAVTVSGQELTLKIVDDKVEPVVTPVEEEVPAPMSRRTTKKSEPEVVEEEPTTEE